MLELLAHAAHWPIKEALTAIARPPQSRFVLYNQCAFAWMLNDSMMYFLRTMIVMPSRDLVTSCGVTGFLIVMPKLFRSHS